MPYDFEEWRKRHIERNDLTTTLVHLTRSTNGKSDVNVLFEILQSGVIKGSTTASGFIIGDTSAACFQDAPLVSVGQNCWYEQTFRKQNASTKRRYDPTGLIFTKRFIYKNGGRPVIYDSTREAKEYLPKEQWWRIVNFDLGNKDIVDWSHEREWRVPTELRFPVKDVVLLFANNSGVKQFIDLCDSKKLFFYKEVKGITTMESVLC